MRKLRICQTPGQTALRSRCASCKQVFSEGSFFLVLVDNNVPIGVIVSRGSACCEASSPGPMGPQLFETELEAEAGALIINAETKVIELMPLDPMLF